MSTYSVCACIDMDAFRHNIKEIRKHIQNNAGFMGVVKANAYGHGAVCVGRCLEAEGADWLAVACVDEGIELRKAGIGLPILVLGYTAPEQYEAMIHYQITPAIFSYKTACLLSETAKKFHRTVNIHIKLDTGMSRIGFLPGEESVREILNISRLEGIRIEGMFTHFACADMEGEPWKAVTEKQFAAYEMMEKRLLEEGLHIPLCHCANSAGIIALPHTHKDMVRAGIILYGMYPSDEVPEDVLDLRPVMSLKSHITYIKHLPEGCGIGYGHTYVTRRETVVATVPVGYGDGYPRQLSNKGCVLIRGKRAPIIGRVCMDQFMVDVTDIPDVCEDDLVTLIGEDHGQVLTAQEVGTMAGSFNYELVCDVGRRVPRVYYEGGRAVKTVSYL